MITKADLSRFRLNCLVVGLILLPIVSSCGQHEKTGTNVTVKTSTSDASDVVVRTDTDLKTDDDLKTTRIEAPFTSINSDEATGHSTLRAPFVKIDSQEGGTSTIRAPFVRIDQQGDNINIQVPSLRRDRRDRHDRPVDVD